MQIVIALEGLQYYIYNEKKADSYQLETLPNFFSENFILYFWKPEMKEGMKISNNKNYC